MKITTPSDAGGVAARQGFKYQDHVAASFVLQMISDPSLTMVECETADDIVLYWKSDSGDRIEYVQVKTTEDDKKWNLTEVYTRSLAAGPTSLAEKSLLCDVHHPNASFRIVSRRDIAIKLTCLTTPLNERSNNQPIAALATSLKRKWNTKSKNLHGLDYWALNTVWQVAGATEALIALNLQRLTETASTFGADPSHSHARSIYEDLLSKVDKASLASKKTSPHLKKITRDEIIKWWNTHLESTEAAKQKTSKPYRVRTEGFFVQFHQLDEKDISRALAGLDARYEIEKWRSKQLAEYLADWLPEVTLKASELVQLSATVLRKKLNESVKQLERNGLIDPQKILAEVMLHAVLRHVFSSEPIACKIFYKTTNGTKSFGSAHILHFNTGDELWLGRAALLEKASGDIAAAASDIEAVLDPDFLKEERQVILTLREPAHLLPTSLENALENNTPVDELLKVLRIPILIAYDSSVLAAGFTEDYQKLLVIEINKHYAAVKARLSADVKTIPVHVFFVPVECAKTLSAHFIQIIKGA